jgi:inorganic triphosphatase YgiF
MSIEIELKLDLAAPAARRVSTAPWLKSLAAGAPKKAKLVSVYYDTDDYALRDKRAALRIRKDGGKFIQNVKLEENVAQGLAGRHECESEVDDAQPDVHKAKDLNGLRLKKYESKLKPIFETDVTRTAIPVHYEGSELEIAVDTGHVKTGRKRQPIHEIEIELKNGNRAAVVALAAKVAESARATYGIASKAERGYALREGKTRDAVFASPIVLRSDMPAAEAFEAIGFSCLHHFASNREAVIAADRDGVHQMRVGLRRLRAAISLFDEMLRDPETETIKTELEWLGDELGLARDMDVMLDEISAIIEKKVPQPSAVRALKSKIARKRAAGFRQAKAVVTGERYRKLVLNTAFWLAAGQWTVTEDPLMSARRQQNVTAVATAELSRRRHKIIKKLADIEELDALRRHKLRIGVKKLRYATEFIESLFGGHEARERWKALAKVLKSLQSSLGKLNDVRMHGKLAATFTELSPGNGAKAPEAFAMGLISGKEQAGTRRMLSDAMKAGRRMADIKPFWKD